MVILVIYTVAVSLAVPGLLIAGWFAARWWYRRKDRRESKKIHNELNRLLKPDPKDGSLYVEHDEPRVVYEPDLEEPDENSYH